ncbi:MULTISPECIES: flavin reductase family protein [Pandoraea]|uniref:Asp/Glu/hydantoin racemase n=1 Tax=Pandoraea capi TaxID=2508286 RepID=A0ABY6W209_9BURK|nr:MULTISPECIES: flavin reductase family protein [Pandoraea]MCI3205922.1 flavin reductase family protein [Pandoraea sp. LA3]MDN4583950.1 flavin reductase family protein [Pandoraea capi]ODP34132.1 Asp/Glu/hydantoin racemase [Pandoraea sp. ISTKB]VVE16883.1 Asp/Glu/hydantoin racemase [Pandoraea capi]
MSHTDDVHFYDPAKGHGLSHDPFKAIVAPRVIGWISSRDAQGQVNLAPYSFFGAFATFPPIIGFCSEGYKDSIANIEATREFVWNLTSKSLVGQMNQTSAPVPHDVDEFELAGLTKAPGVNVDVPHVAESPASLECKLLQVVRMHDLDGKPMNNWLALGQVVGVHIRREFLREDGLFDTVKAHPVMRAGYLGDYAEIGPMFDLRRPKA